MSDAAKVIDIPRRQKKTIAERSYETDAIYRQIIKLNIDEIVTYKQLNGIIGRDIQQARNYLATARHIAQRDNGIVCSVVRNVGIKRLRDVAIVESANASIRSIRRKASRKKDELLCVRREELSDEEKLSLDTKLTHTSFLEHMTKPKAVRKLEMSVKEASHQLPLQKTLEVFREK